MENPALASTIPLVQRASGILVTEDLAGQPDPQLREPVAYDPDGRRRVVMGRDERRAIDRAIQVLQRAGAGMIVVCNVLKPRADGRQPCGQPFRDEGKGTPDVGYGCGCTRIHFR